jgi:3-phenylpropionate/trans-cinnamate dioxygenase ferredoxin subunit
MFQSTDQNWHKIAESVEEIGLWSNNLTELEVNGKKICVGMVRDRFFACTQKCPHAGGTLAEGHIDAMGNIVCPLHRYKFDLKTGRNISGEGYFLKTFPVEVRHDGVFVRLDKSSLFGHIL